ncbi:hypothetical protein Landi51_00276 [Colletotrichum acutatum]
MGKLCRQFQTFCTSRSPLQDARLHMAANSLDAHSQTAHLALDHGKRTLRGLRAAILRKGQCLSLYQIEMDTGWHHHQHSGSHDVSPATSQSAGKASSDQTLPF